MVPCLLSLPVGWSVSNTKVDHDGARVHFNSDRAGPGAAVLHFDEICDLSSTTAVPSEDSRIDRYDRIESTDPFYAGSWYSVAEVLSASEEGSARRVETAR